MDSAAMESDLPDNIAYSLDQMSPIIEPADDFVRLFMIRWYGLNEPALSNALTHGTPEERLFATFALGRMRSEEARPLLAVQLQSPIELERWAAAICLGQWGDKRAAGVLRTMLGDHLPARVEEYLDPAQWVYQYWRGHAPVLLADLGEVDAVPDLHHALQALIALLDQENTAHAMIPQHAWSPSERNLITYEDDIVYCLGRLRAFGVLTTLRVVDEVREKWEAHLIMGSLHGTVTSKDLLPRSQSSLVLAKLELHLQHVFGLQTVEAIRVAAAYLQTMTGWLVVNLSFSERPGD